MNKHIAHSHIGYIIIIIIITIIDIFALMGQIFLRFLSFHVNSQNVYGTMVCI